MVLIYLKLTTIENNIKINFLIILEDLWMNIELEKIESKIYQFMSLRTDIVAKFHIIYVI